MVIYSNLIAIFFYDLFRNFQFTDIIDKAPLSTLIGAGIVLDPRSISSPLYIRILGAVFTDLYTHSSLTIVDMFVFTRVTLPTDIDRE